MTTFWFLFFSVRHLITFLGSAFTVKRGLMLGGKVATPINRAGRVDMGSTLGIAVSEFPLDLLSGIPLWLFLGLGSGLGLILALLAATLGAITWFRRKKLGRCVETTAGFGSAASFRENASQRFEQVTTQPSATLLG